VRVGLRAVGAVVAEGDERTVSVRWTPPNDVNVTSLTVYWCLAASRRRGACAVGFRCFQCVKNYIIIIMILIDRVGYYPSACHRSS